VKLKPVDVAVKFEDVAPFSTDDGGDGEYVQPVHCAREFSTDCPNVFLIAIVTLPTGVGCA